jgi:hypothetical protein
LLLRCQLQSPLPLPPSLLLALLCCCCFCHTLFLLPAQPTLLVIKVNVSKKRPGEAFYWALLLTRKVSQTVCWYSQKGGVASILHQSWQSPSCK